MDIITIDPIPTVHGLWTIGVDGKGKHYATRDVSPRFCFSGDTTEEVEVKAGCAIESYFKLIGEKG